jgi:putative membrane protein
MGSSTTRYTSCGRSSRGYYAQRLQMSKTDERGSVQYQSEDHMAILFQMYGSVWARVLPYCIVNTLLVILIEYLHAYHSIDLTFSDQGHMFMATMVSVLIVARSRISYQRYMESRGFISDITKASRELMQHVVTFSRYEIHPQGRQWRMDIAERFITCLRSLVAVLTSGSSAGHAHAWQRVVATASSNNQSQLQSVLEEDDNERSPLVWIIFLRTAIASHVKHLKTELDVNEELKLLDFTADIVSAYHGLMKLINTPFPFPLVQMTRTFLFVWVFTLPFALMSDNERAFSLITIFFITYGFIGLEFVSIELDDPFGDDPNDLDVLELAKVVFEDIYVCIHDIDGEQVARQLRERAEKIMAAKDKKSPTKRTTEKGFDSTTFDANGKRRPLVQQQQGGTGATFFQDSNDENRRISPADNVDVETQHRRQSPHDKPPMWHSQHLPPQQLSYGSTRQVSGGSTGAAGAPSSSLASLQAKLDAERMPLLVKESGGQEKHHVNGNGNVHGGSKLHHTHPLHNQIPKAPSPQHLQQRQQHDRRQSSQRSKSKKSIVTTTDYSARESQSYHHEDQQRQHQHQRSNSINSILTIDSGAAESYHHEDQQHQHPRSNSINSILTTGSSGAGSYSHEDRQRQYQHQRSNSINSILTTGSGGAESYHEDVYLEEWNEEQVPPPPDPPQQRYQQYYDSPNDHDQYHHPLHAGNGMTYSNNHEQPQPPPQPQPSFHLRSLSGTSLPPFTPGYSDDPSYPNTDEMQSQQQQQPPQPQLYYHHDQSHNNNNNGTANSRPISMASSEEDEQDELHGLMLGDNSPQTLNVETKRTRLQQFQAFH